MQVHPLHTDISGVWEAQGRIRFRWTHFKMEHHPRNPVRAALHTRAGLRF